MPTFIPGLDLCRRFYEEAVRPILPGNLLHAAALIGPGSDVLGFDTPMSMDHDWGPRLLLFLTEEDLTKRTQEIDSALRTHLPARFLGFPTGYGRHADGVKTPGGTDHAVVIQTVRAFLLEQIALDPNEPIKSTDWLTFPEQKLRTIVDGAVYHDEVGLQEVRNRFTYYPHDVWLFQLAACWRRIGQEEHLVGRAGYVGDEVGAAIIAARLVHDLMRLCFLLERTYAPYPKWFGTGFFRLRCGPSLLPMFERVLAARDWRTRDAALIPAYEFVAQIQNDLALVPPLPGRVTLFHDRPFHVIELGGTFSETLAAAITDPEIKPLVGSRLIGGIDLITDNTDVLCETAFHPALRSLFDDSRAET
jgi:hypothetical protein